jgi:hypothetical protein
LPAGRFAADLRDKQARVLVERDDALELRKEIVCGRNRDLKYPSGHLDGMRGVPLLKGLAECRGGWRLVDNEVEHGGAYGVR